MKKLLLLSLLFAGCSPYRNPLQSHKQPGQIIFISAVWVDAAEESDQMLNDEFTVGHWSCPTSFQFVGPRWRMGVHSESASCWKRVNR